MNRYEIITGIPDPVPEEPFYDPNWNPDAMDRIEEGLAVALRYFENIPAPVLAVFEEMMIQIVRRANERGLGGWAFDRMGLEIGKFETLHARCIFKKSRVDCNKKAYINALSPVPPLGPEEQRAGINPYKNLSDQLHALWSPSPAIPAAESGQA